MLFRFGWFVHPPCPLLLRALLAVRTKKSTSEKSPNPFSCLYRIWCETAAFSGPPFFAFMRPPPCLLPPFKPQGDGESDGGSGDGDENSDREGEDEDNQDGGGSEEGEDQGQEGPEDGEEENDQPVDDDVAPNSEVSTRCPLLLVLLLLLVVVVVVVVSACLQCPIWRRFGVVHCRVPFLLLCGVFVFRRFRK